MKIDIVNMRSLCFSAGFTSNLVRFTVIALAVFALSACNNTEVPEESDSVENQPGFRDLNKNGRLDVYEDPTAELEARVDDLISQMTIAEKAGLMFINIAPSAPTPQPDEQTPDEEVLSTPPAALDAMITQSLMSHFNITHSYRPDIMARWQNAVQTLAENTRLGVPVTIATDPRHSFSYNPGASITSQWFSDFPEALGLAATRDAKLVREFADIARQEYRAVGIQLALHPMADLATEPRWSRVGATFGEDAELASQMVAAYITGFQGEAVGPQSVATMTKHFSGGGPQKDGWDPHFEYGKDQAYPGDNFDYHLIPFEEGAFPAGTSQIMPYYGVPVGQTSEDVGFAFNKDIITGLLRERYNFDGVICTDWSLLTDKADGDMKIIDATGWGVEHLSVPERILKALDAGVDQFGGEASPEVIVELVETGQLPEARIDESARRLLRDKFRLGLFDNPYVDEQAAMELVGNDEFRAAGELAQRRSIVLLKNSETETGASLPLRGRPRLYIEDIDADVAAQFGEIVDEPADADFAIIRLQTPYEPRDSMLLEMFYTQGDLDFKGDEKAHILEIVNTVPTIIDINLQRAAVIPDIAAASAGLFASFGATDQVILDAVFGNFNPSGRLPIELPSSMAAVEAQLEDMPYDSEDPLFEFDFGLSYEQ